MFQPKAMTKIMPVALLLAGFGATLAFAGPIEDRQAGMKQAGKSMGMLVPMFKGEKPYDAATVKSATSGIHGGWEKAFAAFTEDSKEGPPETYAKPEIWSDPEGFKAAQKNAMTALDAVAASTDDASFKAALPALGKACGGCHEKFRRPKG